jgi:hypothetical protein
MLLIAAWQGGWIFPSQSWEVRNPTIIIINLFADSPHITVMCRLTPSCRHCTAFISILTSTFAMQRWHKIAYCLPYRYCSSLLLLSAVHYTCLLSLSLSPRLSVCLIQQPEHSICKLLIILLPNFTQFPSTRFPLYIWSYTKITKFLSSVYLITHTNKYTYIRYLRSLKFTLKHSKRSYMFRSHDHPHGAYFVPC